jgi:lipoprotein-releasing system permease protein
MRFEWFVAKRYLRGAHRGRTYISTAGVTIGVAVLVVVISVMNGFEREFLGKMLGAFGHLRLIPPGGLTDYQAWVPRFRKRPGVEGVSPMIEEGVLIVADSNRYSEPRAQFARVRGIDPDLEGGASDLIGARYIGEWGDLASKPDLPEATSATMIDPFAIEAETPGIFLGIEAAKTLFPPPEFLALADKDPRLKDFFSREAMGKRVRLIVPSTSRGPSMQELFTIQVEVKGIFKTGFYDFDSLYLLSSLDTARLLKRYPRDIVEALEVRLDNPDPSHTLAVGMDLIEQASDTYHTQFYFSPWMAISPNLLKAVQIEKVVMSAILTLMVLVAAFGIASTLVMTVMEKTREIGTLMALGSRRRSVMAIFILNGLQVGLFGTFLGILTGLGICELIQVLNIPMPGGGGVYVLDVLPVQIRWLDVLRIGLFSLVASTVAGVYPAWKASKLNPVEALGYE